MPRMKPIGLRKLALVTSACASFSIAANVNAYSQSSFFSDAPVAVNTDKGLRLDVPHEVQDLAYGEFLYDYFQEKYFSAITKALIADYRNQFDHHDQQIQVLVGTLFVGYGLLNEAERIFNDLLEYTTEAGTREQIWFHLAEIYYKRANSAKSLQLLDTHLKVPSDNLQTKVSLLYALNYISTNKLELALERLKQIKDTKNLSAYAYLNLGSVHSLLDQPEKAEKYFAKLLRIQGTSDVVKGIKDRAALALGKHYLESENFEFAKLAFERIRLNSASSNTGLLGLGWAHFKSENPGSALTPWLELTKRSHTDRAVQEAYINIPYVYETLGAMQQALDGYYQASQFYAEEHQRLQDSKELIKNNDWVDQLTPAIDFSFDPLDKIPDFTPPKDSSSLYLYKLFATHDFNEAYRNYRELQRLMQVLNHWHKQIPVFHSMIASHVGRMESLGPQASAKITEGQQIYKEVADKLEVITKKLNTAFKNDDTRVTADTKQLELLDRIKLLEEKVNQLPDDIEYQAEKDRFRVIKGLLMWDLNSTAIERRWERMKDRVFIENQLADLEDNIERIESIRSNTVNRFAGFKVRIDELQARLQTLFDKTQHELLRHRVYLKALAIHKLERRQVHVQQLQANAIYAIARLQDMAFSQHREQSIKMLGEPETTPIDDTINDEAATNQTIEPTKKGKPLSERESLFEGSLRSWFNFGSEETEE